MGINTNQEKLTLANYIFGVLFVLGIAAGGFGLIQILESLK